MTLVEAKKLKKQSVAYVKGSLERFDVDSVLIEGKDAWVIGMTLGGITKKHHTELQLHK